MIILMKPLSGIHLGDFRVFGDPMMKVSLCSFIPSPSFHKELRAISITCGCAISY